MWSVVSVVSKYNQHTTFPIILNQIFNIYNILIYNINKKIMKIFPIKSVVKVWSGSYLLTTLTTDHTFFDLSFPENGCRK